MTCKQDLVTVTKNRMSKRISRTDQNGTPLVYRRPIASPSSIIRIVAHAMNISHLLAPAVRGHRHKPAPLSAVAQGRQISQQGTNLTRLQPEPTYRVALAPRTKLQHSQCLPLSNMLGLQDAFTWHYVSVKR